MPTYIVWLLVPSFMILGFVAGYLIRKQVASQQLQSAENQAAHVLKDAAEKADAAKKEKLLEAQDQILKERKQLEKEYKEKETDIHKLQRRALAKEDTLDKRIESLEKKDQHLDQERETLKLKLEEATQLSHQRLQELERVAAMSSEEAKKSLIAEMTEAARTDAISQMQKIEGEILDQAQEKARDIIVNAIERNAVDVAAEHTVTTVQLSSDDLKGRIIGREGRNIRAFESLAGVDLVIDDTPGVVIISSFDPYRRHIAKLALERLLVDGRIHPTRIEEVIAKVQADINAEIVEAGKQACLQLKVSLPRELYPYIGRLQYRTSYGQNVYYHSIEIANIAGMIAGLIGSDVDTAKAAALLHDIGKTVKALGVGGHALVGAEVLQKYHLPDRIVNAVASHHGEIEAKYIETTLIQVADSISAARPGARRDSLEDYIQRLQKLEDLANTFDGVDKAYVIQAGREVRVLVASEKVSDDQAHLLARDIAKKIEDNMKYPGQIKVTLSRETKVIEYAR